jgi:hypothetical protein
MARRLVGLLIAALLGPCVLASSAAADGDPASDILLATSVFYPYQPPVPAGVQRALNARAEAAAKRGFPIKIALIANPVDLGVIPELFGKPQQYANFLEQEISFQGRQLLLVVMADGYGVQGLPAAATRAIAGLPRPPGKSSTDLARAAMTAVSRAAAAAGHPIGDAGGVAGSAGGGGGSNTPVVIGLVVVAVLAAGGLIALRRRPAERA